MESMLGVEYDSPPLTVILSKPTSSARIRIMFGLFWAHTYPAEKITDRTKGINNFSSLSDDEYLIKANLGNSGVNIYKYPLWL
jgi:hypothetical protein